jgi:hypothetical protein
MARISIFGPALVSAASLAACVDTDGDGAAMSGSSAANAACLGAVRAETGNADVSVLSSSYSEAGTEVIVGVGPQRARWQCIAYSDGSTTRPMSLTNEGSL